MDRSYDKSEIRTALQNWHLGLMMNNDKSLDKRQMPGAKYCANTNSLLRPTRVLGDNNAIDLQNLQQLGLQAQAKKATSRRREPRRHTLQNGIDYNMVNILAYLGFEKILKSFVLKFS